MNGMSIARVREVDSQTKEATPAGVTVYLLSGRCVAVACWFHEVHSTESQARSGWSTEQANQNWTNSVQINRKVSHPPFNRLTDARTAPALVRATRESPSCPRERKQCKSTVFRSFTAHNRFRLLTRRARLRPAPWPRPRR